MEKNNFKNIFVDIKTRTSKIENNIFQKLLKKLNENNKNIVFLITNGLEVSTSEFKLSKEELEIGLKGLMNKGIDVYFEENNEQNTLSFSYINGYKFVEEKIFVFLPIFILNSFEKNSFEYFISLKTFFYLRKKSTINFFNLIIKDIDQNKNIEVSLDELRKIFNISEETYDRFFDFEKNLIKPLVDKINEFSNFQILYEKIKKGENKNNKVIGINFYIENKILQKNKSETNYLTQIIKNQITDYPLIWETVNNSILKFGFESTKRNILFLKENVSGVNDLEIINYLNNNGKNIEEILKLSNHILIKEKYGIYKDDRHFSKAIYDIIVGYDFYYSLNFKFLNNIKKYVEGENFYYKDSTYVIFGFYQDTKGFFKIFEGREKEK